MDALKGASWLIQTEFQPPLPRSHAIWRPRLQAALQQALAAIRLTLRSVPAGYGQTTFPAGFGL